MCTIVRGTFFFSVYILGTLLIVTPLLLFAGEHELRAGFAPSSIWVSSADVSAGESVTIFAALYNSSVASVEGDVIFLVDDVSVAARHFTVDAGAAEIVSASWIALEGAHAISARIEKTAETSAQTRIAVTNRSTETIRVVGGPPLPPSAREQAAAFVKDAAQNYIAPSIPIVTSIAGTVLGATEGVRTSAIEALEKALEKNSVDGKYGAEEGILGHTGTSSTPRSPSVGDGASTSRSSLAATTTAGNDTPLQFIWRSILEVLLFIFRSPIAFYTFVAFIAFLLLRLFLTWMRERRMASH
ncbi:MAG: hypothetical protein Q8R25_01150 [bacterium]|nr:hypothetical protein [bacterium]